MKKGFFKVYAHRVEDPKRLWIGQSWEGHVLEKWTGYVSWGSTKQEAINNAIRVRAESKRF